MGLFRAVWGDQCKICVSDIVGTQLHERRRFYHVCFQPPPNLPESFTNVNTFPFFRHMGDWLGAIPQGPAKGVSVFDSHPEPGEQERGLTVGRGSSLSLAPEIFRVMSG